MNTHQKIPTLIFASITLSALPACSGSNFVTDAFRDKQAAFASLRAGLITGSSRTEAFDSLGLPTSSFSINVAGHEGEALTFADRKNTYSLVLVKQIIFAKVALPRNSLFN